jgi:hypothetical protein
MSLQAKDNVTIRVEGGEILQETLDSCSDDLLLPAESNSDQEHSGEESNFTSLPSRERPHFVGERKRKQSLHRTTGQRTVDHNNRGTLKAFRSSRRRAARSASPLAIPLDSADHQDDDLRLSLPRGQSQGAAASPSPSLAFSLAVATLQNKSTLNVLDFRGVPGSVDEFLLLVEGMLSESNPFSSSGSHACGGVARSRSANIERDDQDWTASDCSDTDSDSVVEEDDHESAEEACHYTRIFAHNGKELITIKDVLSYCIPSVGSQNQSWGIATVVVSQGEDFYF